MSSVKKFEDLVVWQEAFQVVSVIYQITSEKTFKNDDSFVNQIRRASVSVMNNIAEGFERKGSKEFIHFLFISKASCGEVRSMLHLAENLTYITPNTYHSILEKVILLQKRLGSFIKYLDQKNV